MLRFVHPIETNAVVIGAGPVGLFQVFQLGLQGIGAHVIDSLPFAGGQCAALYADKPIYDIPGVPVCTGQELTQQLLRQCAPFAPMFHFSHEVVHVKQRSDGRFDVRTRHSHKNEAANNNVVSLQASNSAKTKEKQGLAAINSAASTDLQSNTQRLTKAQLLTQTEAHSHSTKATIERHFITDTIFIAAGVGAFLPRSLRLPHALALEDHDILYFAPPARDFAGQHLVVMGGESGAVSAALNYACAMDIAKSKRSKTGPLSVTLLHRKDQFVADEQTLNQLKGLRATGCIHFVEGQPIELETNAKGRLSALKIACSDDSERRLPLDRLVALLGVSPRLSPLADWGLQVERKLLPVNPATCATNRAGIFAVGDIADYSHKKKLILCGFHEATMAAFAAKAHLYPDRPTHVLYTTTSPELKARLGVL